MNRLPTFLAGGFPAASDPLAWVEHYTDDAIFVAPGGPVVQGREALTRMADSMRPLSSVKITDVSTEASGNVAAVHGRATWSAAQGPTPRARPASASSSSGARNRTVAGGSRRNCCIRSRNPGSRAAAREFKGEAA
jgi:hypothetical protein